MTKARGMTLKRNAPGLLMCFIENSQNIQQTRAQFD